MRLSFGCKRIASGDWSVRGLVAGGSESTLKNYRRGKVRMALTYQSSRQEHMEATVKDYISIWGSAATRHKDEIAQSLKNYLSEGVKFVPDGVVFTKEVAGCESILMALHHSHAVNEHLSYQPVVLAVNEEKNTVFAGVAHSLKCIGSTSGQELTNKVSDGFAIKKFILDAEGKICECLVCRQMTAEERRERLMNPEECHPARLDSTALTETMDAVHAHDKGANVQPGDVMALRGPSPLDTMKKALELWGQAWKPGTDLDILDEVLAPDVRFHDAYGLQGMARRQSGSSTLRVHNREDAKRAVRTIRESFDNEEGSQVAAINESNKVAFIYWAANAISTDGGRERYPVRGLDMAIFNQQLQIQDLIQFSMQQYEGLKH